MHRELREPDVLHLAIQVVAAWDLDEKLRRAIAARDEERRRQEEQDRARDAEIAARRRRQEAEERSLKGRLRALGYRVITLALTLLTALFEVPALALVLFVILVFVLVLVFLQR